MQEDSVAVSNYQSNCYIFFLITKCTKVLLNDKSRNKKYEKFEFSRKCLFN